MYNAFHLVVVLQQFYGKKARGVVLVRFWINTDEFFYSADFVFQKSAMVYMNMACGLLPAFNNLNYLVEEFADALAGFSYSRHYGHTQQSAQLVDVKAVTALA